MLVACVLLSLAALVLPASLRSTIAGGLRGSIVVPLAALQERAEVSRRAILAYDASLRIADSLRLRASQTDVVSAENERLRQLLGPGAALTWGFVPAEALHGRGLGDDYTMTLTAGRNDGVVAFSPVVAPEGLVGMIETVDASTSIAIVWPHPTFASARCPPMARPSGSCTRTSAPVRRGSCSSCAAWRSGARCARGR